MPLRLRIEARQAELAAVKDLLAESNEVGDPVGVIQYGYRVNQIEKELAELGDTVVHHASVALYFGGRPVCGSRGIAADFAGKTLERFQDIVSKQFAKAELGGMGERGVVPLKAATTLMVTGVSAGSFGFILDELDDHPPILDTGLKETVTEVLTLIESSSAVDVSAFDQAAETLDPRSLAALKEFFKDLDASGATMRIVDDAKNFCLDEQAVHRARERTEQTDIEEGDVELVGRLTGFVRSPPRFELTMENGEVISGSAARGAIEQFSTALEGDARPAFGCLCRLKVTKRTVRPRNRPTRQVYRLVEFVGIDVR